MRPTPPYVTVVITTELDPVAGGYDEAAEQMGTLVEGYDGFLGVESVRDEDGRGISVSHWRDMASLRAWRDDVEHRGTMYAGQRSWYRSYHVRIAHVEREYIWDRSEPLGLHGDAAVPFAETCGPLPRRGPVGRGPRPGRLPAGPGLPG